MIDNLHDSNHICIYFKGHLNKNFLKKTFFGDFLEVKYYGGKWKRNLGEKIDCHLKIFFRTEVSK